MNKTRMTYFETEDILHLVLSEEAEANSVELSPGVTVELNRKGEMIGIEILNASAFLRNSLLESFQFKLLQLPAAELA
ncbi:MAG: DUF2283 domain-containing protein [Caldilineaceae bacterium]|jgi:uncharacterized protein YuzE